MPLIHTETLPPGALFSPKRARRAQAFIEKLTVHTKGSWARKPFLMPPWQKGSVVKGEDGLWHASGIVAPLFGTMIEDEMFGIVRCYQLAWIEVARKNGKSELMAALGLYLLIADGEEAAEVYGAASDKDQAAMVFNVARDMIRLSPFLSRMLEKRELVIVDSRKIILYQPTRSFYRVIAADAAGNLVPEDGEVDVHERAASAVRGEHLRSPAEHELRHRAPRRGSGRPRPGRVWGSHICHGNPHWRVRLHSSPNRPLDRC